MSGLPNRVIPLPPLNDAERACDVGDLLRLVSPFEGQEWEGLKKIYQANNQLYKAVALKGHGWDLVLISGDGPKEVRVINRDMAKYFEVLPKL